MRGEQLDLRSLKFTIDTTRGTSNAESSPNDSYVHQFRDNKAVDCVIEWGDGTSEAVNIAAVSGPAPTRTHVYPAPGIYQIRVTGSRFSFFFDNDKDRRKLQSVDQWGDVPLNSFFYAFYGCVDLEMEATDAPTFTSNTSFSCLLYTSPSPRDA